ncbi:flagellin [Herbaspirillum sp. ST 5-3]|uniref:flagellin N-terminal helical domain-containing protein n=1 Tax=Oxalobacteraceae TaxID=75682 RepID=UPI0010A2F756|nr:flagellin [Herbaspirillum sp. ST 5-3]
MAAFINTNIASLNAQRNLTTSQSSLTTSLQRLSSGLRINSAKDDAAGLGISERMTSQIRGLNQATRNANDGISLAQTGEGALAEISNNLQRIRELAVQSANSTNSSSDRAALDLEVQQRISEIDRVASQTSFNNQKILDGTFGTAAFQVGANVGETISVGLSTSMRATSIGKTADYVNGSTQYSTSLAVGQQGTGVSSGNALATGDLTIALGSGTAVSVPGSASYTGSGQGQGATSAYAKVAAINAAGIGGLTATADTTVDLDFVAVTDTASDYTLTVNGQSIFTAYGSALTGDQVATAINGAAASSGVTATFDSANNRMTLTASDGRDITVSQTTGAANAGLGQGLTTTSAGRNNSANDALTAATTTSAAAVSNTFVGTIRLTAASTITLGGANETYIGYADSSQMALGSSALNSASVTTVANANTAISKIDAAISSVNTLRSTFGAVQNRFESAISNLQATSENLSAARSRIMDADFAQETASLTRGQILQQAGTAMLAQANSLPNGVLALLRG